MSNNVFPENRAVWEKMWENIVEATDDNMAYAQKIWALRTW